MKTPHKLGDIVDGNILGFRETYKFLSNFTPCIVEFEGITYPSVEHAYQAAKTFDNAERFKIKELKSGFDAKQFGNKIDIRIDW